MSEAIQRCTPTCLQCTQPPLAASPWVSSIPSTPNATSTVGFYQSPTSLSVSQADNRKNQSSVIPKATALFLTKQFAMLPPASFLCSLSSSLDILPNSNHLELSLADVLLFQNLQAGHNEFKDAMTLFRKRNQADMEVE